MVKFLPRSSLRSCQYPLRRYPHPAGRASGSRLSLVFALFLWGATAHAQLSFKGLEASYRDAEGWVSTLGARAYIINLSHFTSALPDYYHYDNITNFAAIFSFYFSGEKRTPKSLTGLKAEFNSNAGFYRYDNQHADYLSQAYVYRQNEYFRLEFGRNINIYRKVGAGIPQVGLPYQTLDLGFVSRPPGGFAVLERVFPDSDANADKISFLTAKWNGLQLGGGYSFGHYTFDGSELAHTRAFDNSWLGMAKYSGSVGNLFKTSLSYAYMQTAFGLFDQNGEKAPQREHAFGVNVELFGLTLGTAWRFISAGGTDDPYGAQYDPLLLKPSGYAYGVGLAYSLGGLALSLSHSASFAKEGIRPDETQNYALGIDYALGARAAVPYKIFSHVGYTYFNNREPAPALAENSGAYVVLGVSLGHL